MTVLEQRYIGGDRKRGPIEAFDRVRKGFTRGDLAKHSGALGFSWGVEIGVADGRNSLTFCQAWPKLQYWLGVDPWVPYAGNRRGGPLAQHERNHALAWQRLAAYGAKLMQTHSIDAAKCYAGETFDLIYIDGNHARAYVAADLEAWYPLLKSGGIMAGHDYYEFNGAGVVEAVNEFTEAHGIDDWQITDEREPSFFWVKP